MFSKDFYLTNVLYIPDFSFNLNSVISLIRQLQCILLLMDNVCLIQKKNFLRKIGLTKIIGGLYIYQYDQAQPFIKSVMAVSNVSPNNCYNKDFRDEDLWHYRLGYLSFNRLNELQKLFIGIKCNKIVKP